MIAAVLLCTRLPAPPETVRLGTPWSGGRGFVAFGGRFVVSRENQSGTSTVEVVEPASARVVRRFDVRGYLAGTDEEGLVFRDLTLTYSLEGEETEPGPYEPRPTLLDRGVFVWWRSPGRAQVVGGPDGPVAVALPPGGVGFAVSPSRSLLGIVAPDGDDGPATLSLRRLSDGGRAGDHAITRNGRPLRNLDGGLAFDGEDGVILVRYPDDGDEVGPDGEKNAFRRAEILRADLRGRVTGFLGFARVETPYVRGYDRAVVATLPGWVAVLQQDTVLLYRTEVGSR